MVQGADNRWRTMVNDGLYRQQKAISAIYRAELAEGLGRLGYELERTHTDGRFEIAGIPREVIEAFSTRRAEIEAAMKDRGFDDSRGQGSASAGSGSARRNRLGSRPSRSWTGPRSASRRPRPGGRQAGMRCFQVRSTS